MSSIEIIWTLDPGSTWALLINHLSDSDIQCIYSQRLVKPFEIIQVSTIFTLIYMYVMKHCFIE